MADNMSAAQRSHTMSRIRSRGNQTTERRFVGLLRTAGVRGWRRNATLPGRPDLVFRRERVAVFLDGCFWHGCPRCYASPKSNLEYWGPKVAGNRARDKRIVAQLRSAGWTTLRVWEHAIRRNPTRAVDRLRALLARIRAEPSSAAAHRTRRLARSASPHAAVIASASGGPGA
jgi:DNA mismatch endonuclease (patch repair protein)